MSGREGDCPKHEPGRELSLTLIHAGIRSAPLRSHQRYYSCAQPLPPPLSVCVLSGTADPLPAILPFYCVITTSSFILRPPKLMLIILGKTKTFILFGSLLKTHKGLVHTYAVFLKTHFSQPYTLMVF